MFKRLFFAMIGLGAGVTLGAVAVRKAEQARQKMTPAHLASAAGARAGGLRERMELALAAGREASLAKEAELRAVYRSKSIPEARAALPTPLDPK